MTPNDPLDSRFESASSDLRNQLDNSPIPDFEPRPRVAAPVAAIVIALLVAGAIGLTQLRTTTTDVNITDSPDSEQQNSEQQGDEQQGGEVPEPDAEPPAESEPDDIAITIGKDDTPPADDWTRPDLGQRTNDAAYGTVVTRLTNAGGRFNRVEGNQRQMINADNSLMITHIDDGTTEIISVSSTTTGERIGDLPIRDDAEPIWHPEDAQIVRHLSGGISSNGSLQLLETNVATNETNVIADLTDRVSEIAPTATHMISGFGAPSADGNIWAWMLRDDNEDPVGAISYNLSTDTILGFVTDLDPSNDGRTFTAAVTESLVDGPGALIGVGATPTGTSVVLQYREITTVYDAEFTNYEPIPNQGDYADVALLADGGDAYVYIDFNSASDDAGFFVSVDLQTFERTRVFEVFGGANTSVEVSGAGHGAPGWVVVSTFSCKDEGAWSCNKVMVVELGGQQRIVPLAHTYSCVDSFLAQPLAIAATDLSSIYFNSDGGSCGEDPEVYAIDVPQQLRDLVSASAE